MNYSITLKIVGYILIIESIFMLPALLFSYVINDGAFNSFVVTIIGMIILGLICKEQETKKTKVTPRDGLLVVSVAWIVASIFGAIPLYISRSLPTYIDAFFEIVSGFTTTGASVVQNIEILPKSIVLWRSITHWVGGMGILVFTISLLPKLGVAGFQMFKAESPGPVTGKIEPKLSSTAKRLYIIYIIITITLFILLWICGMTPYDSIVHTLGVVGTGGFSSKANSVGFYNNGTGLNLISIIMGIFMFMCGVNFSNYYLVYKGKIRTVLRDEEFKTYAGIIVFSTVVIAIDLFFNKYGGILKSISDSFFQVTSISSTSGFSNVDYDVWPSFSKYVLYILMFLGSCAGSTAGGMKIVRLVVMYKLIKREIVKVIHPKAVIPNKLNNKILNDEVVLGITSYMVVYIILLVVCSGIVTISGIDIISATSAVVTMLSNVGPGFLAVGPSKNFFFFSDGYKLLFCFLMLLGRLEFFTLLALLAPRSTRRKEVV